MIRSCCNQQVSYLEGKQSKTCPVSKQVLLDTSCIRRLTGAGGAEDQAAVPAAELEWIEGMGTEGEVEEKSRGKQDKGV